ncbi:hypothetical protein LTR53_008812 [Teratosphaeriaceae sp. CCFEE 6253]|nr:hypothetical protein LTR53_008812 [Teratosphaeriaceae sp. CCFEE 6253]
MAPLLCGMPLKFTQSARKRANNPPLHIHINLLDLCVILSHISRHGGPQALYVRCPPAELGGQVGEKPSEPYADMDRPESVHPKIAKISAETWKEAERVFEGWRTNVYL